MKPNPFPPISFRLRIFFALASVVTMAPGLRHAGQFRKGNLQFFWSEVECAAVLGTLGRKKQASVALKRVEKLRPGFCTTPGRFVGCYIMQDEIVDTVQRGLKSAGLDAVNPIRKALKASGRASLRSNPTKTGFEKEAEKFLILA